MAVMSLASRDPKAVATTRRHLQIDLDNRKLLRVFFSLDYTSMLVAIEMIADGTINSTHFFHKPPCQVGIDSANSAQVPYFVSFLDYLIEFYTRYFPPSKQPEEDLIDDIEIIFMVLSACCSYQADIQIRELANDPDIIANIWHVFAQRLKNLPLDVTQYPLPIQIWVDKTFMRGLEELERLPPSMIRAASASKLAGSAHTLAKPRERRIAFYRLFEILLSTPNIGLIRKAVLSIRHLEHLTDLRPNSFGTIAWRLIDKTYKTASFQIYRAVIKAIGELIGYDEIVVEQWYNECWSRAHPEPWARRRYGSTYRSRT